MYSKKCKKNRRCVKKKVFIHRKSISYGARLCRAPLNINNECINHKNPLKRGFYVEHLPRNVSQKTHVGARRIFRRISKRRLPMKRCFTSFQQMLRAYYNMYFEGSYKSQTPVFHKPFCCFFALF